MNSSAPNQYLWASLACGAALLVAGCDDNDNDNQFSQTPVVITVESLVKQSVLADNDPRCGIGGLLIESGLDSNQDGQLSSDEVTDTNVVCDGSPIDILDPALIAQGQQIFRFETFNDESFWTGQLRINEAIESSVSPVVALGAGLKVDASVLPEGILDTADLNDPATTLALISMNAVVGIQGTVEDVGDEQRLTSVGITCALCHSTVDDSVAPGIGLRLDGWPNLDLDPGLIISLSPAITDAETIDLLQSWGPGKYDAYWNFDGMSDPAVIPPAYGLNGVHVSTFTGEGDISYWNAYVAVTQMGGQGNFRDDRLGINIEVANDLVTPTLPALKAYQYSILAPTPEMSSFDAVAAGRGKVVFENEGQCTQCHTGPFFTDASTRLHSPAETGTDPLLAQRATTGMYRTTPLRGVSFHPPYFHNGSAATLRDVVEHYDGYLGLALAEQQKSDLVEYLKSL